MRFFLRVFVLSVLPQFIQGQIATDGTVGTAPAKALEAVGGAYTIDEALGQRADNNLFHSFDQFNINTGESAMFTGDNSIQNVISRVTGGSVSNIDGLLKSTIGSADMYFLNPAGVLFGPNARLDLPGAFHVSTADHIRLGDDDLFYSDPLESSVLSTAAPTAFGFLDIPDAGIEVEGADLSVSEGQTLSLVGGAVELKNVAQLNATAGQLNLVSAASDGEAVFETQNSDLNSAGFSALGEVSVKGNSTVNVDGNGGGRIFIRGGQVIVEDSVLSARTSGDEDGRGVDIEADTDFSLLRSLIDTRTDSEGDAGDVSIFADKITFDGLDASDQAGIFTGSSFETFFSELWAQLNIEHIYLELRTVVTM